MNGRTMGTRKRYDSAFKDGTPPKDDRLMLNAMLWLARSGAGWEDLPKRYGS